ncbi:MAG: NADP-specific glutamate dehydrogenase, partial [Oscillospiraceae bacterium]|nr:NADP-specific glutamate dehydrogenase [Oscillospiraceae bacterium]
ELFLEKGVLFGPAKAANAGGVATSGLEMSQNSMRYGWSFAEVDKKLQDIMVGIFRSAYDASKEFGAQGNLVVGANAAGFLKIAETMLAYGLTF